MHFLYLSNSTNSQTRWRRIATKGFECFTPHFYLNFPKLSYFWLSDLFNKNLLLRSLGKMNNRCSHYSSRLSWLTDRHWQPQSTKSFFHEQHKLTNNKNPSVKHKIFSEIPFLLCNFFCCLFFIAHYTTPKRRRNLSHKRNNKKVLILSSK